MAETDRNFEEGLRTEPQHQVTKADDGDGIGAKAGDAHTVELGFACRVHPRASSAPLAPCPKDCPICAKHFRPLSSQDVIPVLGCKSQHSDVEAAKIIENLAQRTRDNLARIRQSVRTCGDALVKRWQKRSVIKRAALLHAAVPNMKRRMDVLFLSGLQGEELSTVKFQLHLPYLNTEILSEDPMTLLALIHCRSTALMSNWVMFDRVQIGSSFSQGTLEESYNPHYVVMHGEDDAIGELVLWNQDEAHRYQIIGYPLAKMILESQSMLSTFLVDMVNLLLQSPVEPASQGNVVWDSLVADGFIKHRSDHTAPTFRPSAFRAAPGDAIQILECVLNKFQARHAANKRHMWLLQTDPAYARQILATVAQSGVSYTDAKNIPTMLWYLLSSIPWQATWNELEEGAKTCLQAFQEQETHIQPDEDMPRRCATRLEVFQDTLKRRFRDNLCFVKAVSQKTGVFQQPFDMTPIGKSHACQDMAFWALDHIRDHVWPGQLLPEIYISILDHEMRSAKGSKRFNQTFCDLVADLVALDEAIMAVSCIRPTHDKSTQADMGTYLGGVPHSNDNAVDHNFRRQYLGLMDNLRPSLKAFMSTPIPTGRTNRASLAALDASHATLDAFWDMARSLRRALLCETGCGAEEVESHMAAIGAGLSSNYAAEVQSERGRLVAEIEKIEEATKSRARQSIKASPNTPRIQQSDSQLSSHIKTTFSPVPSPQSHGKTKVKTRPRVQAETIAEQVNGAVAGAEDGADEASVAAGDRIFVSPASMDVFRRMFQSYGRHSNANLRWSDFAKAMDDAGFVASWGTGGSAVVFSDSRGKGAIRLHQPHPDPSLNPIMLRSFGKRMFKQFNWSIDTFVEEE